MVSSLAYTAIEAPQRLADDDEEPDALGHAYRLNEANNAKTRHRRALYLRWAVLLALASTLYACFRFLTKSPSIRHPSPATSYYRNTKLVWSTGEATVSQQYLAPPFDKFRFTHFHSVIRSQNETFRRNHESDLFVHTLAFIQKTPFKAREDPQWHVYIPDNLAPFQDIDCNFAHQSRSNTMRYTSSKGYIEAFKDQVGLKIFCPLTDQARELVENNASLHSPLDLTIKMASGATTILEQQIRLQAKMVPIQPALNKAALCLPPFFGKLNAKTTLLWREHHRLMGIDSVHWYARPEVQVNWQAFDTLDTPDVAFEAFVKDYNSITGASDTLTRAPRLDPDIQGKPVLHTGGEYADQVPYMSDCQLRALSSDRASQWLVFSDLDEFIFPNPFPKGRDYTMGLERSLQHVSDDTGAVCLARWHVDRIELLDLPLSSDIVKRPTRFTFPIAATGPARQPQADEQYDNAKCLYRAKAVDEAHVHGPDKLLSQSDGQAYRNISRFAESDIRIIHMGWWDMIDDSQDFNTPYDTSEEQKSYFAALWENYLLLSDLMLHRR